MNLTNLETVFVVFGRWRDGESPHIVGIFRTKEGADKAVEEVLVSEVPRFDTFVREFGVQ
jgi:hypothetical protein